MFNLSLALLACIGCFIDRYLWFNPSLTKWPPKGPATNSSAWVLQAEDCGCGISPSRVVSPLPTDFAHLVSGLGDAS